LWPPIAPLFTDASGKLGEEIRPVIELRLFESKNLSEIGATSGTSKDPDKMRLPRALAKLRKTCSQRGVTLDADAHCRRGLGELAVSRTGGLGGDGSDNNDNSVQRS